MRGAAKQNNVSLSISVEGYIMKGKFVIRLNRKNEINTGWVFLILWTLALLAIVLTAESLAEVLIPVFGQLLLLFVALLYQGFEVIQE